MSKHYRYFVGDFETTVFTGQTFTEVWASGLVELYTSTPVILHSLPDTYKFLYELQSNLIVYYHNLKFDGSYWISYLLSVLNMPQAFYPENDCGTEGYFLKEKDMPRNSFKYSVSDKGQWYTITIKTDIGYTIELRDSLKLIPFSVSVMGDAFKTEHRKLEMEYTGYRYAGCEITQEEKEYLINDLLVVKEVLEIMFDDNHKKITIGACCLSEYKQRVGKHDWKIFFPDVSKVEIQKNRYGSGTLDEYVRHSYRGGWCYVVDGIHGKIIENGLTADVNSLYPSVMHSESGNRYPVGQGKLWHGDYIPDAAKQENTYFFVRVRTRFYLKKDYLPFIQIKGNPLYKSTEMLKTSDVYDKKNDCYRSEWYSPDGLKHTTRVTLTMTMTDYCLFLDHYDPVDFEILDGVYFYTMTGIFDDYIDHYKKIKETSKGAVRTLAKLYLNNLYGKMASSTDSSFKVAYLKEGGELGFYSVEEHEKQAGYIPVGSAITSYARDFTIRHAQMNYYGTGKRGFKYADTDSIHCDLMPDELKGIKVHPTAFNAWKLESYWDKAIFTRQKTYIEHVTHEDGEEVEHYYNVTCAGMPKNCKDLLVKSMTQEYDKESEAWEKMSEQEKEFVQVKRELTDFDIGLVVPGKLMPRQIKGGVLLMETTYEMR